MLPGAVEEGNSWKPIFPVFRQRFPVLKPKRFWGVDHQYISPSYTRDYPLVAKRGRGAIVEDVDGNFFLDFAAGIAVVSPDIAIPISSRAIPGAG